MLKEWEEKQAEQAIYHNLLLSCMDNIEQNINRIQYTQDIEDTSVLFLTLDKIKEAFCAIDHNIQKIKEVQNKLNLIKTLLEKDSIDDSFFSYIDELNTNNDLMIEKLIENNYMVFHFLNYHIKNCNYNFKLLQTKNENDTSSISTEILTKVEESPKKELSKPSELQDNRTLIISEKENLAYLPYYVKDIEEVFYKNQNKYHSLQDVIDKNYVLSLDRFKNPILARFREAFSLMKNKEHATLPKCLDLALELSFNNLLNPTIISACRNLEELDIYLDCLETNELDKFPIFEVKYEVTPQIKL